MSPSRCPGAHLQPRFTSPCLHSKCAVCTLQGVAEGDAEIPSGEVVPLEYNLVRGAGRAEAKFAEGGVCTQRLAGKST